MKAYEKAVAFHLHGLKFVSTGPCPGCDECGLAEVDAMDCDEYHLSVEASFSWSPCDCCGSSLGGDRLPAHGFAEVSGRDILLHMSACVDCAAYLANGTIPEDWENAS